MYLKYHIPEGLPAGASTITLLLNLSGSSALRIGMAECVIVSFGVVLVSCAISTLMAKKDSQQ